MQKGQTDSFSSVSVVVPTLNGGDALHRCLRSVLEQQYEPLEIIVVDNGSTDGSQIEILREIPAARLIANDENKGFAEACNQGADRAAGQYLLFLNNDARLAPGSLDQMVKTLRTGPYRIVQPLLIDERGAVVSAGYLFTRMGFLWHQMKAPAAPGPFPVFCAQGACMLVHRETFSSLGGFPGSYFAYFEEADLCWRARMAGIEVGVAASAAAIHEGGRTTRRVLEPHHIYYLGFRNRLRSLLSNPSVVVSMKIVPPHVLACLGAAAAFALRGRWRVALAIVRALTWPLRHPGMVKDQRRSAQSLRSVPDREVFRPDLSTPLSVRRVRTLLEGSLTRWEAVEPD